MNKLILGLSFILLSFNCYSNTIESALSKINNEDYAGGINILFDLANKNNPDAFYYIGYMYSNGIGVSKNNKEAFSFYMKSAELGHSMAQNNVGSFYYNGTYVNQSYKKALDWFVKSADQGNDIAMNTIAAMYLKGQGLKQSQSEAIRWFKIAADKGNKHALKNIIAIYKNIAKQGDSGAMHNLGLVLTRVSGEDRDVESGVAWLEKAAQMGLEESQKALIRIYNQGLVDYPTNKSRANYWKQKLNNS